MLVTSFIAPSATWIIEIASLALRTAWFKPLICEVIFEEIAKPAASSFAELMRRPVDSLSMVELIERSLRVIALDAMFADMFVLIVAIVIFLLFLLLH
jgi:hypothetical protein